ncbi:MAG: L,D-transpeptidase family protein [bacterium]|nr:L,D-transpeptidase family protein [bacterium]
MKRKNKRKLELAGDVLAFIMFISACQKEIALIKEHRPTGKIKNDTSISTYDDTNKLETLESNTDQNETISLEIKEPPLEFIVSTIESETTQVKETSSMPIDSSEQEESLDHTESAQTEAATESIDIVSENKNENSPVEVIAYTTTDVNLRADCTTKALVIANLSSNTPVNKIISCENNWDLVEVDGQIGFICRDYLIYTNQTYKKEHNFKLVNDIAITTTELNFRSGPSTEYPVKKTLITKKEKELTEVNMVFKKNEELRVVAEVDNDWLLIEYNGEFGYVRKDYTTSLTEKLQISYPELNIEEFNLKKIVYSNPGLRIRKENNIESEIVRELEQFESLRVLGEYDDWYLIMTNEHEFGFVNKSYVTELTGKTIIIDKSEQRMYMYNDNERLIYTPVTTGKDSTPTDTGLFKIHYMAKEIYLNKDKDWVFNWMNYNSSNEGIHDAWWRQVYGEENYHTNGSNGCDNTPYAAAKTIYENSSLGQKVLVHK